MSSFFYHLAFDLTTELTIKASDAYNCWEAFQITRKKARQQVSTSITVGQLGKSATGKLSLSQPGGDHSPLDSQEDTRSSSCTDDWRYGKILTQGVKMAQVGKELKSDLKPSDAGASNGIGAGQGGIATKGRFEASSTEEEELGWGVVRLYKDGEETPSLYDEPVRGKGSKTSKVLARKEDGEKPAFKDEDCTTLCILAVPSYLTPSDFLGFVGEKTREEVSHFRMIRTEKSNRYMVLMKFRNGRKAREWRKEWNGKAFDGLEPENCHVVFVKSIVFLTPSSSSPSTSFPDMTNDPFTPSTNPIPSTTQPPTASSRTTKPLAPPTPSLIELPTCPVCLERMDESTGLLTILCQHVFHCSCLQKWRGSGCPVCRYTQHRSSHPSLPSTSTSTNRAENLNECSTCHSDQNLWICLICGNVGCGRYDAAHAFAHYSDSAHTFAMDLSTQRVWDYASDAYVHRLVQDAHDGKLVDLGSPPRHGLDTTDDNADDYDDFVPREKLHAAGEEYTHLLTSQLDSQRMYFEGILERAADKASVASQSADKAAAAAEKAQRALDELQERYDATVPQLQKENERSARKAGRFEAMAREMEKGYREEKTVSAALMTRIEHLQGVVERVGVEKEGLAGEKRELEEMVRDLMVTVSGRETVAEMGGEVEGGSVSLPEGNGKGGRKRKGGGKK
ncbi:MAG: hypothetical protein Q9195_003822 [Heterodermia aff. obscurata]